MTNRRDLLKHFGIGAIIAPIIGGNAEGKLAAQLVTVPKVEPIELHSTIPQAFVPDDIVGATIELKLRDGSKRTLSLDDSSQAWGSEVPIGPGERLYVNIQLMDSLSPWSEVASVMGSVRLCEEPILKGMIIV